MYADAFVSGFRDSWNLCAFVFISLFALALMMWAFTLKRVLTFGFFFLLGFWIVVVFLFNGVLLEQMASQSTWIVFTKFLQIACGFCLLFGLINLLDWSQIFKGVEQPVIRLPFTLPHALASNNADRPLIIFKQETRGFVWFFLMADVYLFLGAICGVITFVWPQDYNIYIISASMVNNYDLRGSVFVSCFYALGMTMPFVLMMLMRIPQVVLKEVGYFINKFYSTVKIIFAAVFMSVGFSLWIWLMK